jgi:hypothetical protein
MRKVTEFHTIYAIVATVWQLARSQKSLFVWIRSL